MDPQSKILSHDAVDAWMAEARAAGLTIGFTCGAFDLMHAGHAHYLARARSLCDRLLVAVNTDDSIRRYKSPLRPINPLAERQYLLAALASVDAVTELADNRPLHLLLRWKPDLYIKGGDYAVSSLRSGDAVRAYGGRVEVIRPEFGSSSSAAIERIAALHAHAAPMPAGAAPATGFVLLDRDGVLIRDVPFNADPERVELAPGAGEALARLQAAGMRLAIVTNQQGIGLGYSGFDDMVRVNQRVFRELAPSGALISKVYFCPHTAADCCACRKPAPGMLLRAMRDFATAPERTYFLGDTAADLAAGAAAGVAAIAIGDRASGPCAYRASGLPDAARWILARHGGAQGEQ
jgi:rfaE bifunctional protein nucleotidyltransferase chain/domain